MTTSVDVSLGRWLAERAKRTPNRRALTFEGTTWTYRELQERIDGLAAALRSGGVCHGDRVGFIGLNQPAFLETLFAAARLGAIFVPLNFRLTGPEGSFIVNDAGIHTLVVDEPHRPLVESVKAELPVHRFIDAEALPYENPIALGEPLDADEIACIMYTSGTTGRPKGAM